VTRTAGGRNAAALSRDPRRCGPQGVKNCLSTVITTCVAASSIDYPAHYEVRLVSPNGGIR
jgi:hypothetical protein